MAVVPRKIKNKIVFRVAVRWKGKQYWETAGTDRREAERLEARRKREVKAGTYVPPEARTGGITIGAYAERFFDRRNNRNAESERTQVERHALSIEWFNNLKMEDARPLHFVQLVKELRAKTRVEKEVTKRALVEKSIANILGTIRTMFGDAQFNEIIPGNPCVLPRKTLKRRSKPRAPYTGTEVAALLSERVDISRRAFIWVAFYTGMREGEVCGRRWRDWIRDSRPLGALLCTTQYNDQPLKGDDTEEGGDSRPRVIPVHPELAKTLAWWWTTGWELVHCRKPEVNDFMFPLRTNSTHNHTRSSAYKLWRKACVEAGVTNHSLHSTRHTFTTFARRGTPRTDAIEAITHNKRGEMVDYYNHWGWTPLCEALLPLNFAGDAEEVHPLATAQTVPLATAPQLPGEAPNGAANGQPTHASIDATATTESAGCTAPRGDASDPFAGAKPPGQRSEVLPQPLPGSSNYPNLLWRRRELKTDAIETASTNDRKLSKTAKLTIPKNAREVRLAPPTPPRTNIVALSPAKTMSTHSSMPPSPSTPSALTSHRSSVAA